MRSAAAALLEYLAGRFSTLLTEVAATPLSVVEPLSG